MKKRYKNAMANDCTMVPQIPTHHKRKVESQSFVAPWHGTRRPVLPEERATSFGQIEPTFSIAAVWKMVGKLMEAQAEAAGLCYGSPFRRMCSARKGKISKLKVEAYSFESSFASDTRI